MKQMTTSYSTLHWRSKTWLNCTRRRLFHFSTLHSTKSSLWNNKRQVKIWKVPKSSLLKFSAASWSLALRQLRTKVWRRPSLIYLELPRHKWQTVKSSRQLLTNTATFSTAIKTKRCCTWDWKIVATLSKRCRMLRKVKSMLRPHNTLISTLKNISAP